MKTPAAMPRHILVQVPLSKKLCKALAEAATGKKTDVNSVILDAVKADLRRARRGRVGKPTLRNP